MSKTIRNIVLTGGPCAGKTTAKSWIKTELEARGWTVLFAPETATELMLGGMNPRVMGELDYQRCAMPYTYAKEESFKRAAELVPNDKVLVVYDRGVMDQVGYMLDDEFRTLQQEMDLTVSDMLNRYDSVIHLVTAADGAEEVYSLANNAARTETAEQAREMDAAILSEWLGHSRIWVVPNRAGETFDDKMRNVVEHVANECGEPYIRDIQCKFLIEKPDADFYENYSNHVVKHIEQRYLTGLSNAEQGQEHRYRRMGSDEQGWSYTETTKRDAGDGLNRLQTERLIDASTYYASDDQPHVTIEKDRHFLVDGEHVVTIDEYPNDENLAVLEIRLSDARYSYEDLPDGIHVVADVTDEPQFRNFALAKNFEAYTDNMLDSVLHMYDAPCPASVGDFVVISGPSGVGKDTLLNQVLEQRDDIEKVITVTTRDPRPGEVDGESYYFMGRDEFDERLHNGEFIEHASVHGNRYGTLASELVRISDSGKIPVLLLDVQGKASLEESASGMRSVFIAPESLEALETQLRNRGTETESNIQRRIANASEEMALLSTYDFMFVNDWHRDGQPNHIDVAEKWPAFFKVVTAGIEKGVVMDFDLDFESFENAFNMDSTAEAELPKEIEYKYLIHHPPHEWFMEQPGVVVKNIEQTYVEDGRPGETRVRRLDIDGDVSYVVTNKRDSLDSDGGVTRVEIENEVTPEEAHELLQHPDPNRSPIHKTRYVVPFEGHNFEFDVYPNDNDYSIVEVELGSANEQFRLPDGVDVVADVTRDRSFKNSSLAKHFPEDGFVALYKESTGISLPRRADAQLVNSGLMDDITRSSASTTFDITD